MTALVNLAANNRKLADAVLRELFETLEKRNSARELAKRLEGANSIQSRYVLMLYWLQRSLGAEDFRYEQVADSRTLTKPEAVLSQQVKAEKQHLLPFQKAQLIYGTDLGRGESHIVNGIGNLTYISRALNDFIGGLGERFAQLDLEPPKNIRAHFLWDESASAGVLRDYGELVAAMKDDTASKVSVRAKSVFERMVGRRRALVGEAFGAWLEQLAKDSAERFQALCIHDGTHSRLEPGAPMYVSTVQMADAYQVRRLDLPHADEDRLIDLIGRARRLKPYKNDPALRFQLTKKRKLIWVKALPGAKVHLRFDSSLSDSDRANAIGLLGLDPMVGPVPKSIEFTSVPRFEALLAEIEKGWLG
jgi:hypothetical protein